MELQPRVGEIVAQLREAAANWDGLMPPCAQAGGGVSSGSEEPISDSEEPSEFETLTLP